MESQIKKLIVSTVNAFETGSAGGNYALLTVFRDGKGNTRQITYGRSQTTEQGNLKALLLLYVENGGKYAKQIAPYIGRMGKESLVDNKTFKNWLVKAGQSDPIMIATQDQFFDRQYFLPAMKWAADNGFVLALSRLVIYDSFVHSGSIMWFLRQRFLEVPPINGGDERAWIRAYMLTRLAWLRSHENDAIRRSAYRAETLLAQIEGNNWALDKVYVANGAKISSDIA